MTHQKQWSLTFIPKMFQDAIFALSLFAPTRPKKIRNSPGYYSSFSDTQTQKVSRTKHSILKHFGYISACFASLALAQTEKDPRSHHIFVAASGVGAITMSNHMTQQYGTVQPGGFIPTFNSTQLNYGTGGIEAAVGYQQQMNELWHWQSTVQYLYLAPQNQQTAPFYQTNVYDSAFFNNIGVQTVTFNLGINRTLFPKLAVYADAGIGAAILSSYSAYFTNAPTLPVSQTQSQQLSQFTWQAGGGAQYNIAKDWRIDGGVHYANFGNVNFGSYGQNPSLPDGINYKAKQFGAVLFRLGLNYTC